MSDLLKVLSHEGPGIEHVYNNGKWLIFIKNWTERNDPENLRLVEIHHTTDQQFMLVSGRAWVITAPKDMDETTELTVDEIEIGKIYDLPTDTWFNSVLSKDARLYCTQDPNAAAPGASEYRDLSSEQADGAKAAIRAMRS